MSRTLTLLDSLTELLDQSSRPIYAIDAQRRVVYCNPALGSWLELEPEQIVGRLVEYHSVPAASSEKKRDAQAPLADLCPPPQALVGQACVGTISCVARGGRLAHRHADFVPLHVAGDHVDEINHGGGGVLVLLRGRDLSQQELAEEVSGEPSADQLHRAIRRFRRAQASHYVIESLLGDSSLMRKVRAQVAAAAASGANVLVAGRPGTGRGHIARAIHYRAAGDAPLKLVPIDCELTSDDMLRRALDAVSGSSGDARHRSTLLLENLDHLPASHQSQLLAAIRQNAFAARIVATCGGHSPCAAGAENADFAESSENEDTDGTTTRHPAKPPAGCPAPATIDPHLLDIISTITIGVPRIVERLEDLPILAQCFLEACNPGSGKQIGSLRADTLDQLSLYDWPGELDELREVIAAAHGACTSHEIAPADLPVVVHHALQSASRLRRPQPERIVLDELLAQIEREAIVRALAQADGNKTEAAEVLGMTRPRLYRRLVQLGLAGDTKMESEPPLPEFIERPPSDDAP